MLVASVASNAWITAPAWFGHAPWIGVHPIDLVFPVFVTLSGAGLGIAYSRRVRVAREVRRVAVLFLAGVAYTALNALLADGTVEVATFDATGVLQLYAALVAGMLVLRAACRRWWHWLIPALVLGGVQTTLLARWARGCPDGLLTRECNPSRVIDAALFGSEHLYHQGRFGHDPGGAVVFLGALASAACGAAVGRAVLDHARGAGTRSFSLAAATCVAVPAVAWVASAAWVPTFKRLWTAPFAFMVATGVAVALLGLHVLLDGRRPGPAERLTRYPLCALGRNSLLVYFGSHVLVGVLTHTGPDGRLPTRGEPWARLLQHGTAEALGSPGAAWPLCVLAVAAWTTLACLLHRHRIYVKA